MENQNWDDMLDKYPSDPTFIKLYALRSGICTFIYEGGIAVAQGTVILQQEHGQAIIERHNEELWWAPKFGA